MAAAAGTNLMTAATLLLLLGVAVITAGCPSGCSCGPARLASKLLVNVTAGAGDRHASPPAFQRLALVVFLIVAFILKRVSIFNEL